jgi:dipeptidyl-peptidase-4
MPHRLIGRVSWQGSVALAVVVLAPALVGAQDRLKTMPGYEQYARVSPQITGSLKLGVVQPFWTDSGKAFEYQQDAKWYRYDVATRKATEISNPTVPDSVRRGRFAGRGGPERGRQFASADSPDGKRKAFYKDRNLWVSNADGSQAVAVTTDGSEKDRIKYGTASWVYGEELRQTTAMWWSPDGTKLAYYRFDESKVPDYYLQLDQTKVQSTVDTEAYPKAGAPNPIVDLFVYDATARQSTKIDVRDGKAFDNGVVGHYVYAVSWSPDGKEITFNRTNRRQNIMEYTACSPSTGACRAVVHEEWTPSWVSNRPTIQFLSDNKRFLWESERTGWRNYYLYDFATGKLVATVTNHAYEVAGIVRLDEKGNALYYMARDGDNHMKLQLHRVGLDGKGDKRLTDPTLNHAVTFSPDGKYYVDVAQTHDKPPTTVLATVDGKQVATIATTDVSKFEQLGLRPAELYTFTAADGKTQLFGMLQKPSTFDSTKKYPVLVTVYAGPATNGARETFSTPSPLTEYGFIVLSIDSRSAAGRGKRFLDAIYQKLGTVEIDDQAEGVKALWDRPYIDRNRVGIFGTSYGGYASGLALLRHPEVFAAASSSSPVTDWRHYDSIYTERYMWLPDENKAGYDAGSLMTYADKLKGRLMLYYGTADNNVHPSNMMQLITSLQRAGKSFDVQVGPDRGHSGINTDRMMEFFIENLVMRNPGTATAF